MPFIAKTLTIHVHMCPPSLVIKYRTKTLFEQCDLALYQGTKTTNIITS